MKKFLLASLVRVALILVAVMGVAVCAFWYPFTISLSTIGFESILPIETEIACRIQLIFYWAVSLPCFAILVFGWLASNLIRKGRFFSDRCVKLTKIALIMFFVDLAVFLIGNIVFYILGWNVFAINYSIIFAIGLEVAILTTVFLYFLNKRVKKQKVTEGLK